MKNLVYKTVASALFLILSVSSVAWAGGVAYNRNKAITYANDHCKTEKYNHEKYKCFNPNNPNCENYNKGGGTDCANFISQALIDGGLNYDCHFGKGKGDKARADRRETVEGSVVIGKSILSHRG